MANPLEEQRLRNLEAIIALGRNPYGSRLERTGALDELAARALSLADGEHVEGVTAVGRIMAIRSFGKAAFLELRDRTGRLQAYVRKNSVSAEDFALFEKLDTGDHLRVTGSLGKSKTGEPTVFCASLDIVSKALLPPPEKWHGLRDVETRYRKRYVDLFNSPEAMARFLARSAIIDGLRRFFVGRGFVEVETPMMQDIAGGAAARPFVTHHNALDMDLFLRVAPEIPLKKLLVGGMERVFEINRNFRNEGIDTRHHPEFTMLEAYQAYGNYEVMMELTEAVFCELLEQVKALPNVQPCEALRRMTRPWPRRRFGDLIQEHAGVDPDDEPALRAKAAQLALPAPPGAHKDVIADELFGALVEPTLRGPVFVTHQPLSLTPLAKAAPGEPPLAERFELYLEHIECANAYTELNDPIEQERRFRAQIDQGQGEHRVVDESFVDALKYGMPPAGGLGIGVDRLVMMLTDTHAIRDVILFPLLRRAEG